MSNGESNPSAVARLQMPLTDQNPPAIYPHGCEIADLAALAPTWFLFTAKYQCVKRLAFDLCAQGIAYYLPLARKSPDAPLRAILGPYIFVAMRSAQFASSNHIDRTKVIVENWLLEPQLAYLKSKIDSGEVRSLSDLHVGDQCRVKKGAFKGYTARIEAINYDKNLAFLIGLVPNSPTEIDLDLIEAI